MSLLNILCGRGSEGSLQYEEALSLANAQLANYLALHVGVEARNAEVALFGTTATVAYPLTDGSFLSIDVPCQTSRGGNRAFLVTGNSANPAFGDRPIGHGVTPDLWGGYPD